MRHRTVISTLWLALLPLLAACGEDSPDQRTQDILAMLPGGQSYVADCAGPAPTALTSCDDQDIWQQTLAQKAAYYDQMAPRYHVPEGHGLVTDITIANDLPVDSLTRPLPLEENPLTTTYQSLGDNDGYWTEMYVASQAFRYASTTGEDKAKALENLRTVVPAVYRQLQVTGVEGLYCRTYWDEHLLHEMPSGDNWYPGAGQYSDMVFKGDVSKDEYSGHMFGMGVVYRLVDDPEVRELARKSLEEVGNHLLKNRMKIVDVDGLITKHGDIWATSTAGMFYPGFNATLALSWIKLAAAAAGTDAPARWYDRCLLKITGENIDDCVPEDASYGDEDPYPWYLADGFNLYFSNCGENYNNFSMGFLSMYNLVDYEENPELKAFYQWVLEERMFQVRDDGIDRDIITQGNSFFNFLAASQSRCGLKTEGFRDAVQEGICTLRRFPPAKYQRASDTADLPLAGCRDRFNEPTHTEVVPIERRGISIFIWTRNPYNTVQEAENRTGIVAPSDFLLAYWMGRYYGYIDSRW